MENNKEYLVSVYMTTYFHEKYVEQAIESILSQNVNFDYEIVISDDASKDATPEILKQYGDKYDFIKININETNIGLTANMFKAKLMCSGKYIVPLSGDDYWIDNNKIQKQVDFLETHSEYIGVASRIEARTEFSENNDFVVPRIKYCNMLFGLNDYLHGRDFPTNGFMMRNVIRENLDLFSVMPKVSKFIDDTTDCLLILTLGNIYITDDITVAYRRRVSTSGEHNFNSINSAITIFQKEVALLNGIEEVFSCKYDLYHRYKTYVAPALFKCSKAFKLNDFFDVYNEIPLRYRKRCLLIRSFMCIFIKGFEIVLRKFGR